jgi:hypothetical protein
MTTVELNFGLVATVDDDFVFIDGNTFANKDRLKALGAKWVPAMKSWMLGSDVDLTPLYKPAVAAAATAAAAAGGAGAEAPATPLKKKSLSRKLPRETLNFGLKAIIGPDCVYIKGLTFENKRMLESLGATWSKFEHAYILPAGFDLTPLRVPDGEEPIRIPVPEPKPYWFCGHKSARIVCLQNKSHTCSECAASSNGGRFFVRGSHYTGN